MRFLLPVFAALTCIPAPLIGLQISGYSSTANDRPAAVFPCRPSAIQIRASLAKGSMVRNRLEHDDPRIEQLQRLRHPQPATLSDCPTLRAPSDGNGSLNQQTQGSVFKKSMEPSQRATVSMPSTTRATAAVARPIKPSTTTWRSALTNPVTAQTNMQRIAVLDLNPSSNSDSLSAYSALDLFLYGRSSHQRQPPSCATAINAIATTAETPAALHSHHPFRCKLCRRRLRIASAVRMDQSCQHHRTHCFGRQQRSR